MEMIPEPGVVRDTFVALSESRADELIVADRSESRICFGSRWRCDALPEHAGWREGATRSGRERHVGIGRRMASKSIAAIAGSFHVLFKHVLLLPLPERMLQRD